MKIKSHWKFLDYIPEKIILHLPLKFSFQNLNWKYYYVEGDLRHLFRSSKYEGMSVVFYKSLDHKW